MSEYLLSLRATERSAAVRHFCRCEAGRAGRGNPQDKFLFWRSPRRRKPLATTERVGFTLIEVLLTMAFLSLLLAGTAELALHSVRSKAVTDGYFRRTGILTAKLEGLKALTFNSDGLRAGEYREDIESSPPEPAALAEWRIDDRGSGAKWIDLRITLPGRPGRNLHAVLVVSKFLGF